MSQRPSTCYLTLMLVSVLVTACAVPNLKLAAKCEHLLTLAEKELDLAKSKGFTSSISLTKAGALIGAARIQQQFDKYPNCINKAERARNHVKISIGQN